MSTVGDLAFGHRQNAVPSGDGPRSEAEPWAAHIRKSLGFMLAPLLGYAGLTIGVTMLPELLGGLSIPDILLHTSSGLILLITLAVVLAIWSFGRGESQLDLDRDGIAVATRRGRYFYDWRDIDGIEQVKAGVRLRLKERSADQNQYNLISNRFVDKPGGLRGLLSKGLAKFADAPRSAIPTPAPGDDLRSARASARRPDDLDLVYARSHGTVPIVYDLNHPHQVSLNFGNRVFARNPVSTMFGMIGIIGGVMLFVLAIPGVLLVSTLMKALSTRKEPARDDAITRAGR